MSSADRMARLRLRQRADHDLLLRLLTQPDVQAAARDVFAILPELATRVSDAVTDALKSVSDGPSQGFSARTREGAVVRGQGVLPSEEGSYPLASQGGRGSGGGPAARAVPKANKSGELMDRLRAAGVEFEFLEKHHAALKRTRLSAAQVAEVWIAITEGRFGDAWLCDHVNVERAIAAWPNYQNRKTRGPRPSRGESASARAERVFEEAFNGAV